MKLQDSCWSIARRPARLPLWLFLLCVVAAPLRAGDYLAYVGTYTTRGSKGIYVSRFAAETGRATAPSVAAETENPTFLELHPNGSFLYAVNEVGRFREQKAGAVSAYRIDRRSGQLTRLNQVS